MNYSANVAGVGNQHYPMNEGCGGYGSSASWILVLFILLVILSFLF